MSLSRSHGSYTTLAVESLNDHSLYIRMEFPYPFHPFLHRRGSPSTLSSFCYALLFILKSLPHFLSWNGFLQLLFSSFCSISLLSYCFLVSPAPHPKSFPFLQCPQHFLALLSLEPASHLCLTNDLYHLIFPSFPFYFTVH